MHDGIVEISVDCSWVEDRVELGRLVHQAQYGIGVGLSLPFWHRIERLSRSNVFRSTFLFIFARAVVLSP